MKSDEIDKNRASWYGVKQGDLITVQFEAEFCDHGNNSDIMLQIGNKYVHIDNILYRVVSKKSEDEKALIEIQQIEESIAASQIKILKLKRGFGKDSIRCSTMT